LGFSDIHLYGFDSSFEADQHAYDLNKGDPGLGEDIEVSVNGRKFTTTIQLLAQAQQFMQQMAQFQQAQQQAQAIQQANQQKQSEFAAACALIREDGVHGFKIDIEADSTIAPDEQAEKAARTDFLGKFIPMMEQVIPIAQGNPPMAALAKEITMFVLRGFHVARSLEEAFEAAFDAIAQMPPNPKMTGADKKGAAAGQNPQVEQAKIAADVHDTQTKAQTDQMAIAQKAQQAQSDTMTFIRNRQINNEGIIDQHSRDIDDLRGRKIERRPAIEGPKRY
jgi:hypothetical protein